MDTKASINNGLFVDPDQQQISVGLYLLFIGLLGTVANCLVLAAYFKVKSLASGSHLLIINLCVADLGMCIFGFPFSASSSFANRWLYGDAGCLAYAFTGFLFGSASIGTLTMLAWDQYQLCYQTPSTKLYHELASVTSNKYRKMIISTWLYAVFWSVMPLIGWGRYNYEPSNTTCTIDWRHNDFSYKSFIITYFILGYLVPIYAVIRSYYKLGSRAAQSSKERPNTQSTNSSNDDFIKISVLLGITFVVCWSGYAVVCLWAVFADAATIPLGIALLPPLLAKASTFFNPLLLVIANMPLRQALFSVMSFGDSTTIHPSFESLSTAGLLQTAAGDKKGGKRKIIGNE